MSIVRIVQLVNAAGRLDVQKSRAGDEDGSLQKRIDALLIEAEKEADSDRAAIAAAASDAIFRAASGLTGGVGALAGRVGAMEGHLVAVDKSLDRTATTMEHLAEVIAGSASTSEVRKAEAHALTDAIQDVRKAVGEAQIDAQAARQAAEFAAAVVKAIEPTIVVNVPERAVTIAPPNVTVEAPITVQTPGPHEVTREIEYDNKDRPRRSVETHVYDDGRKQN